MISAACVSLMKYLFFSVRYYPVQLRENKIVIPLLHLLSRYVHLAQLASQGHVIFYCKQGVGTAAEKFRINTQIICLGSRVKNCTTTIEQLPHNKWRQKKSWLGSQGLSFVDNVSGKNSMCLHNPEYLRLDCSAQRNSSVFQHSPCYKWKALTLMWELQPDIQRWELNSIMASVQCKATRKHKGSVEFYAGLYLSLIIGPFQL